jgi:hypothetical protein
MGTQTCTGVSVTQVEIFARKADKVRSSASLHSEEFPTLAKAQKLCKGWKRGYKGKLCNYFFRISTPEGASWHTLSDGELIEIQEPESSAAVSDRKSADLEVIEAQIAGIRDLCSKLDKENSSLYQEVERVRATNRDVAARIQQERNDRRGPSFLDGLADWNRAKNYRPGYNLTAADYAGYVPAGGWNDGMPEVPDFIRRLGIPVKCG